MHQSYEKSVKRICAQLRDESDFRLQTTQITEWLFAAVMSPVKHPGGIQAQRALGAPHEFLGDSMVPARTEGVSSKLDSIENGIRWQITK
jgi:hypothetical protein